MKNKNVLLFSVFTLFSSALMAQQNWKVGGNSLNATGKFGTTTSQDVNFISNNISRMSLKSTGNLRFNSDQTSILFANPGATPKPMMFIYESGSVNTSRMVFAYSPGFPNFGLQYTLGDRMDFLGGGISAMTVDLARKSVGIGTTNTENFKVKIVHGNGLLNGLAIENSTNPGIEWSLFTGAGNSPLNFIRDGALLGQISFPSGQYLALSDERLKTNIRPMASVLDKISRLKPSSYQFKNAKSNNDYDGFIAQEVMKIFPSLVQHTIDGEAKIDVYTMDYSGFGVIAIKGIQELMKQNEEKDAKIDAMQKQIDELKAVVFKGIQNNAVSETKINTSLTDATLEQNAPNPFANTASIRYSLPQKFTNAEIIITDNSGKTIKQIKLSGSNKGIVNVDASVLSAGSYNYALVVDGRMVSTKQMIIAK